MEKQHKLKPILGTPIYPANSSILFYPVDLGGSLVIKSRRVLPPKQRPFTALLTVLVQRLWLSMEGRPYKAAAPRQDRGRKTTEPTPAVSLSVALPPTKRGPRAKP